MLGISYKALLYKVRQFGLDSGRAGRGTAKETSKAKDAAKDTANPDPVPASLSPAGRHS